MGKKFEIPKEKREATSTEPRSIIIYSAPKIGKTTIVAQLPHSLLIEHEVGGADAVAARCIEINNPNDLPELAAQLKGDDSVKYIIIDTITKWDEWSELTGTYAYMKKPQGKKFNVVDGTRVNHNSDHWDTVHSIGEGYGYRYSRNEMMKWFKAFINTGKTIIFLAHIKDKFIEAKSGDIVETIDLNLTGKVKSIYSVNVDAVAHLKREGNEARLVFENMGNTVSGSRYNYLQDSILISEFDEETKEVKTYWENIFPSLKNN